MNKWLMSVLILGVQMLFIFNIWTYVEGNNDFDISGNKSAIYQVTKNNIEDEYEKLRRDKITPWSFLQSGHSIIIIDYYGKEIDYSGIKFEGTPELKFWNGFIEPFLKDIIFRAFDNTIQLCRDKKLYSATPIRETGQLLNVLVRKVYSDMADVDRTLRGAGFPQNIEKKDVSGKAKPILNLIDERVESELSVRKRLTEFYHNEWMVPLTIISLIVGIVVGIIALLEKFFHILPRKRSRKLFEEEFEKWNDSAFSYIPTHDIVRRFSGHLLKNNTDDNRKAFGLLCTIQHGDKLMNSLLEKYKDNTSVIPFVFDFISGRGIRVGWRAEYVLSKFDEENIKNYLQSLSEEAKQSENLKVTIHRITKGEVENYLKQQLNNDNQKLKSYAHEVLNQIHTRTHVKL